MKIVNYLLLLFIIFTIYYLNRNILESFTFSNQLPNYIWMYWEDKKNTQKPAYLELCYKTVLKHCSKDFEIILLNENTIYNYLPNIRKDLDKKLNIPQKTDYYRYWLLYLYGGIWLDFDTIVFKSLKPFLENLRKYDYVGAGCHYNNCKNNGYPKPANWLMISRPKTSFIKSCINQCDKILDNYESKLNYFKLGRSTMWDRIKFKIMHKGWKYYHLNSNCLERDSNFLKIRNTKLLSNENIDEKCINKSIILPIYNTSPGFPDWFKKMNQDQLLKSNLLISKYFRKSLIN